MASDKRRTKRSHSTRGWKKQSPNARERTKMLRDCGKKCFLSTRKRYPICTKNTCRINPKGVQSAYNRARQQHNYTVARRAKQKLRHMR